MNIHETIIPWTAEWIVFYEIWRITGQWHGLAAPHGTGEKTPETIRAEDDAPISRRNEGRRLFSAQR
jgi:hypothetical protein